MSKIILTSSDPIVHRIYSPIESIDLFGEEYLEEYGIEIPAELLVKYLNNQEEFWQIQKELDKYADN